MEGTAAHGFFFTFNFIYNMASRHQVRCINKQDRDNPWERIINIGGVNHDNTRWKLSQQAAIEHIEKGKYEFYVQAGTQQADVIVEKSRFGNKYLKTKADTTTKDNLLSLPECPA
jgi:hypothetical protein